MEASELAIKSQWDDWAVIKLPRYGDDFNIPNGKYIISVNSSNVSFEREIQTTGDAVLLRGMEDGVSYFVNTKIPKGVEPLEVLKKPKPTVKQGMILPDQLTILWEGSHPGKADINITVSINEGDSQIELDTVIYREIQTVSEQSGVVLVSGLQCNKIFKVNISVKVEIPNNLPSISVATTPLNCDDIFKTSETVAMLTLPKPIFKIRCVGSDFIYCSVVREIRLYTSLARGGSISFNDACLRDLQLELYKEPNNDDEAIELVHTKLVTNQNKHSETPCEGVVESNLCYEIRRLIPATRYFICLRSTDVSGPKDISSKAYFQTKTYPHLLISCLSICADGMLIETSFPKQKTGRMSCMSKPICDKLLENGERFIPTGGFEHGTLPDKISMKIHDVDTHKLTILTTNFGSQFVANNLSPGHACQLQTRMLFNGVWTDWSDKLITATLPSPSISILSRTSKSISIRLHCKSVRKPFYLQGKEEDLKCDLPVPTIKYEREKIIKMSFRKEGGTVSGGTATIELAPNTKEHTINNLSSNTMYSIVVYPDNNKKFSSTVITKTLPREWSLTSNEEQDTNSTIRQSTSTDFNIIKLAESNKKVLRQHGLRVAPVLSIIEKSEAYIRLSWELVSNTDQSGDVIKKSSEKPARRSSVTFCGTDERREVSPRSHGSVSSSGGSVGDHLALFSCRNSNACPAGSSSSMQVESSSVRPRQDCWSTSSMSSILKSSEVDSNPQSDYSRPLNRKSSNQIEASSVACSPSELESIIQRYSLTDSTSSTQVQPSSVVRRPSELDSETHSRRETLCSQPSLREYGLADSTSSTQVQPSSVARRPSELDSETHSRRETLCSQPSLREYGLADSTSSTQVQPSSVVRRPSELDSETHSRRETLCSQPSLREYGLADSTSSTQVQPSSVVRRPSELDSETHSRRETLYSQPSLREYGLADSTSSTQVQPSSVARRPSELDSNNRSSWCSDDQLVLNNNTTSELSTLSTELINDNESCIDDHEEFCPPTVEGEQREGFVEKPTREQLSSWMIYTDSDSDYDTDDVSESESESIWEEEQEANDPTPDLPFLEYSLLLQVVGNELATTRVLYFKSLVPTVFLTRLIPNTQYRVKLFLYHPDCCSWGDCIQELIFTTLQSTILEIADIHRNQIFFNWRSPVQLETAGGDPGRVPVRFCLKSQSQKEVFVSGRLNCQISLYNLPQRQRHFYSITPEYADGISGADSQHVGFAYIVLNESDISIDCVTFNQIHISWNDIAKQVLTDTEYHYQPSLFGKFIIEIYATVQNCTTECIELPATSEGYHFAGLQPNCQHRISVVFVQTVRDQISTERSTASSIPLLVTTQKIPILKIVSTGEDYAVVSVPIIEPVWYNHNETNRRESFTKKSINMITTCDPSNRIVIGNDVPIYLKINDCNMHVTSCITGSVPNSFFVKNRNNHYQYTVDGLSPECSYKISFSQKLGCGGTTLWSDELLLNTLPPLIPSIQQVGDVLVNISWSRHLQQPSDTERGIFEVTVEGEPITPDGKTLTLTAQSGSSEGVIVSGLVPYTSYIARVRQLPCRQSNYKSTWSTPVSFSTLPVSIPKVLVKAQDRVDISWERSFPPSSKRSSRPEWSKSPLCSTVVKVVKVSENQLLEEVEIPCSESDLSSRVYTTSAILESNTLYTFCVRMKYNLLQQYYETPWSKPVFVTTLPDTDVNVTAMRETCIVVKWCGPSAQAAAQVSAIREPQLSGPPPPSVISFCDWDISSPSDVQSDQQSDVESDISTVTAVREWELFVEEVACQNTAIDESVLQVTDKSNLQLYTTSPAESVPLVQSDVFFESVTSNGDNVNESTDGNILNKKQSIIVLESSQGNGIGDEMLELSMDCDDHSKPSKKVTFAKRTKKVEGTLTNNCFDRNVDTTSETGVMTVQKSPTSDTLVNIEPESNYQRDDELIEERIIRIQRPQGIVVGDANDSKVVRSSPRSPDKKIPFKTDNNKIRTTKRIVESPKNVENGNQKLITSPKSESSRRRYKSDSPRHQNSKKNQKNSNSEKQGSKVKPSKQLTIMKNENCIDVCDTTEGNPLPVVSMDDGVEISHSQLSDPVTKPFQSSAFTSKPEVIEGVDITKYHWIVSDCGKSMSLKISANTGIGVMEIVPVTQLTPNRFYKLKIRYVDLTGRMTSWSEPNLIRTLPIPEINVLSVSETGAELSWKRPLFKNENGYPKLNDTSCHLIILSRSTGCTPCTCILNKSFIIFNDSSKNSYRVTGLHPGFRYTALIRYESVIQKNNISVGHYGPWSALKRFGTLTGAWFNLTIDDIGQDYTRLCWTVPQRCTKGDSRSWDERVMIGDKSELLEDLDEYLGSSTKFALENAEIVRPKAEQPKSFSLRVVRVGDLTDSSSRIEVVPQQSVSEVNDVVQWKRLIFDGLLPFSNYEIAVKSNYAHDSEGCWGGAPGKAALSITTMPSVDFRVISIGETWGHFGVQIPVTGNKSIGLSPVRDTYKFEISLNDVVLSQWLCMTANNVGYTDLRFRKLKRDTLYCAKLRETRYGNAWGAWQPMATFSTQPHPPQVGDLLEYKNNRISFDWGVFDPKRGVGVMLRGDSVPEEYMFNVEVRCSSNSQQIKSPETLKLIQNNQLKESDTFGSSNTQETTENTIEWLTDWEEVGITTKPLITMPIEECISAYYFRVRLSKHFVSQGGRLVPTWGEYSLLMHWNPPPRPKPATCLRVVEISSNCVVIKWNLPINYTMQPGLIFDVFEDVSGGGILQWRHKVQTTESTYIHYGLQSATRYRIAVRAESNFGRARRSNVLAFTTHVDELLSNSSTQIIKNINTKRESDPQTLLTAGKPRRSKTKLRTDLEVRGIPGIAPPQKPTNLYDKYQVAKVRKENVLAQIRKSIVVGGKGECSGTGRLFLAAASHTRSNNDDKANQISNSLPTETNINIISSIEEEEEDSIIKSCDFLESSSIERTRLPSVQSRRTSLPPSSSLLDPD